MNKRLVSKGYNKIARRYSLNRNQFENLKYLEKLNSLLKPNSRILDLGCGAGKPIDEFFINHGHKIIGIDISSEQVTLLHTRCARNKSHRMCNMCRGWIFVQFLSSK